MLLCLSSIVHGAGLNDGLAGKIALRGRQCAVVAREGGEREEEVVKTASVIAVVEFMLGISFQGLPVSMESYVALGMLAHPRYRSGENGGVGGIRESGEGCRGMRFDDWAGGAKTALVVADSARGV
jgi:hypothetical protein